ncbi:MAG: fibronectin type III domain-containing protein [Candidatus Daviesbacteria bacterium]|nr:fibronectin type III domain-containing protein [Candidatus Daviesbacteria bacterium]
MNKIFSALVLTAIALVVVATPASAASLKGEARWKTISGAVKYHLYYKVKGDKVYTSAVSLPASSTGYTVTHLRDYAKYLYNVAAVDASGKEYSWSGEKRLFKSF